MQDPTVRKFMLAADQRFTSAGILYREGLYLDAMYIAGYAPECALKALILATIPGKRRGQFMKQYFRGTRGHNLELLRRLLKRTMPIEVARLLTRLATWSTDLRYEVGLRRADECREF